MLPEGLRAMKTKSKDPGQVKRISQNIATEQPPGFLGQSNHPFHANRTNEAWSSQTSARVEIKQPAHGQNLGDS